MSELTEFLLARIAEDEADPWRGAELFGTDRVVGAAEAAALRAEEEQWEARALRECEAKRRIVGLGPSECGGYADQAEFGSHHYPDPHWTHCDGCAAAESVDATWQQALRALASVYADHPDYRDEWKP